ncbi:MAG: RloB domain-containing protein [Bacteroidetes bacterium]|uniref:RloB domain-containing protein n=1 Tax=Candidatus Gallipaludibacter merdavium TaxID=2840839 RepID=A0A9D9N519_9BACT|nr:RloB domain-containing protein [Candidatus Gallipaludibacter merdavium]
MKSRREKSSPRKMKKVFVVFCEGETEECYLNFLRATYRSPIKVIPRISGDSINERIIREAQKSERITDSEKITTFVMYDLDKADMNERLKALDAIHLFSNPCVELWFLLHVVEQRQGLTTAAAIKALVNAGGVWMNYNKPILTQTQRAFLWEHRLKAIEHAKVLKENTNPSSTIYKLLESLEQSIMK